MDLKEKTRSWDETFNEYELTKREKQLMRNFNIKYECFDAHDDFRAQMKAGTTPGEWPISCFDEINEDNDFDDLEHDSYTDPKGEDLLKEPDAKNKCKSEMK